MEFLLCKLEKKKKLFTLRVVGCRLPREVVEFPSVEILKTQLDCVGKPALDDPSLNSGVGLDNLHQSMLNLTALRYCDPV